MGCYQSKSKSDNSKIVTVKDLKVQKSAFVQHNPNPFQEIYSIGRSIGTGAFGEVRRVVHRHANATRAAKIFRKDLAKTEEAKQKLNLEIDILKSLDHPNIIRIYEFFEDPKRFYIVMEHCNGGELFEEILKRQSFGEVHAAQIVQQILSAVAYLHDRGIVHRDLKPENILLEERGDILNIKLIDFGTAVFLEKNKTIRGALGTAYYIAPEVLTGYYNEKCDMWSIGVIIYILLSGVPPFDGKTDDDIIEKVKKGNYSFAGAAWRNISREAKDLISSLLCPPANRLTAPAALLHPWIAANASRSLPSVQVMQSALSNLKGFHNNNKLRDAVQTFIATQCISQQDTKDMREAFRAMDTNGDGKLSKEELLAQYVRTMGPEMAEVEVNRIMAEADSDNNGFIDYTEFLKATLDLKTAMSAENLKVAFDVFDKDGSGKISTLELKRILEGGAQTEKSLWNMIVNEVDLNGDGEIDFSEFQNIILSKL
ncbi:unnamed protein product [Blepharisma stoltei]|uniref:Calcium-dependent protein kinase 1 n=1 Tax=Blepharisma stoltei TaxID=1481888 RepID=A0AAU9IL20_9CILI|nr:unnamed protein product [Blepharisma stoltei]